MYFADVGVKHHSYDLLKDLVTFCNSYTSISRLSIQQQTQLHPGGGIFQANNVHKQLAFYQRELSHRQPT